MGLEIFENGNRFLERMESRSPRLKSLGIGKTPSRVIHQENKVRLMLYDSPVKPRSDVPILMIPSMINRPYILDLMPGKSLVEFLLQSGYRVAMIDWGAPGDEDRDVPFDRYIDDYLRRSTNALLRETGAQRAVLVGYCLGGTMALIHSALRPENVAGLVLLTTPTNFHNSGLLSAWCRTPAYDVDTLVRAHGNVPWRLMQSTFQWLRPTMSATRMVGFLKRIWDDEFINGYAAMETWANDNVSFPGRCYAEFIRKLYHENCLVRRDLWVGGRPVEFDNLRQPLLAVTASDDHIVPADASQAIRTIAASPDFTELVTPGGHIGAIISRKAAGGLWGKMKLWLDERYAPTQNMPARPQPQPRDEPRPEPRMPMHAQSEPIQKAILEPFFAPSHDPIATIAATRTGGERPGERPKEERPKALTPERRQGLL